MIFLLRIIDRCETRSGIIEKRLLNISCQKVYNGKETNLPFFEKFYFIFLPENNLEFI